MHYPHSLVFALEITTYILDLFKSKKKWYYLQENEKTMECFYSIYPFTIFWVVTYLSSNYIFNHIKYYAFMDFGIQQFYYMPQYDFFIFFLLWTYVFAWIYSLMSFIHLKILLFQTFLLLYLLFPLLLGLQSYSVFKNEINEKLNCFIVFHMPLKLLSIFFIFLFSMLLPGYFLLICLPIYYSLLSCV